MSAEKQSDNRDLASQVIAFFTSVKLTLAILAAIVVMSFLGVTGWFGVEDVYHSKPFQLLMGLLFTNLLACTIERFPSAWRKMRMDMGPVAPPPPKKPDYQFIAKAGDVDEALAKAEKLAFGSGEYLKRDIELSAKKSSSDEENVGKLSGKASFKSRGKLAVLGPHVTHLGILITIAGALIGSLYPFNGFMWLKPGEESNIAAVQSGMQQTRHPMGFTIRCNDFKITQYEKTPMASDYLCDLSILENGREVTQKVIEVNSPLHYQGYGIYQSSYRYEPKMTITATFTETGDTVSKEVTLNSKWDLPGTDTSYTVVDFEEDAVGMGMSMGPKLDLAWFESGEFKGAVKLFERYPNFDKGRGVNHRLAFDTSDYSLFTGLRIIKDPGLPVVWVGFALIILGTMQSFFIFHHRFWLVATQTGEGVTVNLIGRAQKAPGMLESRLEKMAESISSEFERKSSEEA